VERKNRFEKMDAEYPEAAIMLENDKTKSQCARGRSIAGAARWAARPDVSPPPSGKTILLTESQKQFG